MGEQRIAPTLSVMDVFPMTHQVECEPEAVLACWRKPSGQRCGTLSGQSAPTGLRCTRARSVRRSASIIATDPERPVE